MQFDLLKIADLQAHNALHREYIYRAEVVNVGFVIMIKIYKVTSN